MHIGAKSPDTVGSGFIPIDNNSANNINARNVCEATATWKMRYIFADQWCKTQCAAGNCPEKYCKDTCRH